MSADSNQEMIKTKSVMRSKSTNKSSSMAIRIRQKTKSKLAQLLQQANKERIGRRVKVDDLILFALGLITDHHLIEICDKTLSNKDRLELLYRKLSKEKHGITREEFFGILLDGKATL